MEYTFTEKNFQSEVLESDGFEGIRDRTFDAVVTNPPIRAGKEIDRLYVLDGCKDGAILTIKREAAKKDIAIK